MFDKEYIEELRVMSQSDDKAEQKKAKEELAEYASAYGIKVKKTMSFENMVSVIETELEKLAKEMEDTEEDTEGTSINDLILAADTIDGKVVFDEVDESIVDAMSKADHSAKTISSEVEETPVKVEEPVEIVEEVTEPEPVKTIEEDPVVEEPQQEVVIDVFSDDANHKLDADSTTICDLTGFYPTINLIGGGRGYYTCPWWIFQWIMENPDWKKYPERFPHAYVHDTLKSLIYYIKRDGSVKVRETKNSQFHTLK